VGTGLDTPTIARDEGSVRRPRTAGGRWSYRLDLGIDETGRRAQKQVGGFRTKKAAQAALNDALSGIQHGTYIAPSRQTLGVFLDMWIEGPATSSPSRRGRATGT
jgi:hypothetical protein